MPDNRNIRSPYLIVGPGRTASSYVLHILKQRGDVQTLIENELVMEMWKLVTQSWWSRHWPKQCTLGELEDRYVRAAREMMIALFPSAKPHWAYKAIWEGVDWDLYEKVYPNAKYIHLVRDPRTNIMSMMDFIGRDEGHSHWDLDLSSQKYVESNLHALGLAERKVPFLTIMQENLIEAPQETWRKIFTFLGLDYVDLAFELEINTSQSTKGRVDRLRTSNRLRWSDLSSDVRHVAKVLGYKPG